MGTTYGSVVVLNAANQISGPIEAVVDDGGIAGATNDAPRTKNTIQPSGTIHSLKGQILDISFLDTNGALVCNNIARDCLIGSGASSERKASDSDVTEDDNLDIDFSYLASSSLSNSIASNFFGGSSSLGNNNNNGGSSDLNNNNNAASNQNNDDNLLGGGSAFMTTFNQANFAQSFDESSKPSNKTNKS